MGRAGQVLGAGLGLPCLEPVFMRQLSLQSSIQAMHDGPLPAFSLVHLSPFSVLAFSPISHVSSQSSDTLNG